jgi:hypothetical protein
MQECEQTITLQLLSIGLYFIMVVVEWDSVSMPLAY